MQDFKKWFDWAGLEVAIMDNGIPIRKNRKSPAGIFAMDIGRKGRHQTEFIRLCPGDGQVEVRVIDVNAKCHQVVMLIHEPRRVFTETVWDSVRKKNVQVQRVTPGSTRTMLVGKDQTHLFIAQLPARTSANTVKAAHRALKPNLVRERERKTSRIKRQGEWFFIPVTPAEEESIEEEKAKITRRSPLGHRSGPRAHMAEELITTSLGTFARGSIRHPDHRPIELNGWFRVTENEENRQAWAGNGGVRWMD